MQFFCGAYFENEANNTAQNTREKKNELDEEKRGEIKGIIKAYRSRYIEKAEALKILKISENRLNRYLEEFK